MDPSAGATDGLSPRPQEPGCPQAFGSRVPHLHLLTVHGEERSPTAGKLIPTAVWSHQTEVRVAVASKNARRLLRSTALPRQQGHFGRDPSGDDLAHQPPHVSSTRTPLHRARGRYTLRRGLYLPAILLSNRTLPVARFISHSEISNNDRPPETSIRQVFTVADRILRAGRLAVSGTEESWFLSASAKTDCATMLRR